jgi:hypothetical protein
VFLSRYEVGETVYVPMLHDGVFESYLSVNNKVLCSPSDKNFETLWEVLQKTPETLSRFIETYKPTEETSSILSEVLKVQTNNISKAYNILSLCRRSQPDVLMGGQLSDRSQTFDKKYISQLRNFKIPFEIVSRPTQFNFVFQDLTYLQNDEIRTLPIKNKYLFVTNNKQHLHYFDGANYSSLDGYYLIWR